MTVMSWGSERGRRREEEFLLPRNCSGGPLSLFSFRVGSGGILYSRLRGSKTLLSWPGATVYQKCCSGRTGVVSTRGGMRVDALFSVDMSEVARYDQHPLVCPSRVHDAITTTRTADVSPFVPLSKCSRSSRFGGVRVAPRTSVPRP